MAIISRFVWVAGTGLSCLGAFEMGAGDKRPSVLKIIRDALKSELLQKHIS